MDGSAGAFNPGTAAEDPFSIEGENIVFGDPDAEVRSVCTPAG